MYYYCEQIKLLEIERFAYQTLQMGQLLTNMGEDVKDLYPQKLLQKWDMGEMAYTKLEDVIYIYSLSCVFM
jgi:hypothetical protein